MPNHKKFYSPLSTTAPAGELAQPPLSDQGFPDSGKPSPEQNKKEFKKKHLRLPFWDMSALAQGAKKEGIPILDNETGAFLQMLVKIKNPSVIFDVGCGYGHSSLWIGSAALNAEFHLFDFDNDKLKRAQTIFLRHLPKAKTVFWEGDARKTLSRVEKTFDFAFLDTDKVFYKELFLLLIPKMNPGALLVIDNLFFRMQIFDPELKKSGAREILAMMEVLDSMKNHSFWILDIADGILVIQG